MRIKVIVTGIDVTTGSKDKASFKLTANNPFVYLSITTDKNWAMIGDGFELELTNANGD